MNLPDVPLWSLLREKMSWLSARQNVLSENVANQDVSGFQARDLKPLDFEQMLKDAKTSTSVGLTTTDPRHIAITRDPFQDEVEPVTSGNTVSAEEEMMKISDTQAQYRAATNMYAKSVQMMRTAIDANH